MRSSTSSEGPRLVRIAVPCAQTRVAMEMHSRMNGAKRREACSAGHRASSEARDEVCSSSYPGGRSDRARTLPLQWRVRTAAIDLHRSVWSTK